MAALSQASIRGRVLPVDGRQLYARLITTFASGVQYADYTYTATTAPAQLLGSFSGGVLTLASVISWPPVNGAQGYELILSGQDATNAGYKFDSGEVTSTSVSAQYILQTPGAEGTVSALLRTHFTYGWVDSDNVIFYCYIKCVYLPSQLTSPIPGILPSGTVTFTWTPIPVGDTPPTEYDLNISSAGDRFPIKGTGTLVSLVLDASKTSVTVNLPTDGRTLLVSFESGNVQHGIGVSGATWIYTASRGDLPSINQGGVVSNISGQPVIAPGSWVSIYGSKLAPGHRPAWTGVRQLWARNFRFPSEEWVFQLTASRRSSVMSAIHL